MRLNQNSEQLDFTIARQLQRTNLSAMRQDIILMRMLILVDDVIANLLFRKIRDFITITTTSVIKCLHLFSRE